MNLNHEEHDVHDVYDRTDLPRYAFGVFVPFVVVINPGAAASGEAEQAAASDAANRVEHYGAGAGVATPPDCPSAIRTYPLQGFSFSGQAF